MRSLSRPVLALTLVLVSAAAQAQPPASTPAPDWGEAQTIEVDLTNFAFSPARLELKPGAAYRLHFVNKTSGGHDFTAKGFFNDAVIDPEDQAAVKDGMVMLGGNQSADVRLMAPKAGRYEARCTHLMHATLGMKGEVVVQ
jgi:plastocyanin